MDLLLHTLKKCLIMLTTVTPSDLWFPIAQQKGMGMEIASFSVIGPRFFNALPDSVKQSLSVDSFKSCLKTYLFTLSDSEVASLF